jgi:uncharacterized membrane protein (Fun14 family)
MVENKDPVEQTLDKLKPLLSELSFGSVMGYCSGYAFKKVGKALAFVVGVGFIGLQTVVSTGYIDVNWGKMKEDALKKVDAVSNNTICWSPFSTIFRNAAGGWSVCDRFVGFAVYFQIVDGSCWISIAFFFSFSCCCLSFSGYLLYYWKPLLPKNSDGTVTVEDAKEYWKKLKALLTNKLPSAGGFSLGFLYGVTYG